MHIYRTCIYTLIPIVLKCSTYVCTCYMPTPTCSLHLNIFLICSIAYCTFEWNIYTFSFYYTCHIHLLVCVFYSHIATYSSRLLVYIYIYLCNTMHVICYICMWLYCICVFRVLLQAHTCTSLAFTCINYAYARIYMYPRILYLQMHIIHIRIYITYTYARLNICKYY
jgi:hypothetical protein